MTPRPQQSHISCITEVIELELKEELATTKRKLESAKAALEVLESAYRFASMKNHLITLDSIPGYLILKKGSE